MTLFLLAAYTVIFLLCWNFRRRLFLLLLTGVGVYFWLWYVAAIEVHEAFGLWWPTVLAFVAVVIFALQSCYRAAVDWQKGKRP